MQFTCFISLICSLSNFLCWQGKSSSPGLNIVHKMSFLLTAQMALSQHHDYFIPVIRRLQISCLAKVKIGILKKRRTVQQSLVQHAKELGSSPLSALASQCKRTRDACSSQSKTLGAEKSIIQTFILLCCSAGRILKVIKFVCAQRENLL